MLQNKLKDICRAPAGALQISSVDLNTKQLSQDPDYILEIKGRLDTNRVVSSGVF